MIDHRRLGRELDLFVSDPLAGAGLPIWLPAGAAARHAVEEYVRELERRAGYQHVYSPPLGKRELFELSGHWATSPTTCSRRCGWAPTTSSCSGRRSARTTRWSSGRGAVPTGSCRCGSPSWAGCTARSARACSAGCPGSAPISLNDAHNFCAPEQVGARSPRCCGLIREAHAALGVRPAGFRLSLRGAGREVRRRRRAVGPRRGTAARRAGRGGRTSRRAGEAAFYGPKIDIQIVDAGRSRVDHLHHPAGLRQAGPVRPVVHRLGRRPAPAGDGAPQPGRQHGAAVRVPDRGARRAPSRPGTRPVQVVLLPVDDGQADAAADAGPAGASAPGCGSRSTPPARSAPGSGTRPAAASRTSR